MVRIKTTMDSFLAESGGMLHDCLDTTLHADHVGADPPAATDAAAGAGSDASSSKTANSPAEQPAAASPAKRSTCKRCTRKQGKTVEMVTSAFEIQPPPVESCVKRPRCTQNRNVRLSDYVVGHVHAVQGEIEIPTTYKQARASKY
ncbi:unnamed protein product [Phytophthora fragariaefolia]|uniref:Unnamed protein product n=1 Tax=Phytophthora fragariaefolia TaxID=1490495 RepID=A0A9W6XRA6_9STRA|nr:unnamed protein product [Phytophthora fragariaefolia]